MATTSSKSSNPFQSNGWNYFDQVGESTSSYLPNYYENDIILNNEAMTPAFRSVSPKIYHQHQQKKDYFNEMNEELTFGDDCDALYEATLLNSNFLDDINNQPASSSCCNKSTTTSIDRLRQILGHISPNYYKPPSALSDVLLSSTTTTPSVRSQFSSSKSPQQPVIPMVAISMPDPRDKGKGKFKPTL